MAVNIKNWLPHIVFGTFSAAILIVMFLCNDMRYDKGEEFLNEFIEKKELDKAVKEGWFCYRGPYGDSGSVMYWVLNEYGQNGVCFLLHQLESGDNTRIAVALDELRFALEAGGPVFGEPTDTRIEEGKKDAHKIILGSKNDILRLAVSNNPVVRRHAVRLLAETCDMDIVPEFKEIADSKHPAEVRANAIGGLSMLHWDCKHSSYRDIALADQIQGWIDEYLADSEALVRVAAVSALDTDDSTKLIRKMQQDSDIRVRVCAALKLYEADLNCKYGILISGVSSSAIDKETKLEIAFELAQKGDKPAIPVLANLIGDPELTRGWGMDLVGGHFGSIGDAMANITGIYYGPPDEDETLEEYGDRIKSDALEWWEKHKSEVMEESK